MSPDNTYKDMAVENAGRISFCAVDFKFATDDAVKQWFQEGGLSKWVVPEALPTGRFAYEVAWRVVLGDLPAKRAPAVLQAAGVTTDDSHKDTGYVLGDSIVVVDAEIDQLAAKSGGSGPSHDEGAAATAMAQAGKQKLKEMANELILAGLMSVQQLAEVAETEFLLEGGYTFTKQPQFKGKVIRVNTKLMYTQTKFNLLAEESEGYAKVATLLGQEGTITEGSLESAKRTIQSLIGFFDLDPNRVLDITMDSFEMNPGYSILLNIISMFKRSGRAQVLGFKFQYYQREQVSQATPQSLYRLAGRLIKEDLIDIDALWPHLTPSDEEGVEEYQTWLKERVAEANRYGVVNLASTEATGAESEQVTPANQNVDVSRPAAFEEEGVKQQQEKLGRHQKLGLLEGLLHADDWTRAQMVLERLGGLAPLSWPPVAKALCRAVTLNVAPFYSATQLPYLSGKKSSSAAVAPNDETPSSFHLSEAVVIPARVVNMLLTLGPYLYRDGALFTKVCRSLRAHILTAAYGFPLPNFHVSAVFGVVQDGVIDACTPGLQSAIRNAATVLEKVLLPALMVTPANPAMSFEVWEVLKLLPYELRYELYGTWDSVGAGNNQEELEKWLPMLIFARKFANVEARKILRRVADIKDKAFQQHELLLNKLTHANPMVTLSSIVKQMENYTAMIPAAIAAFKGLNYLEHEIVEYLILQALAQKRDRLKDSGLDTADWLQHLAEFVGSWGKKHHSVINLHGILQMMVKQAINGQPWDLVILQEMLGQMANVRVVEDTQEDLQEAMAGGEKLYFEAFNIGSMKLTKQETKTVNKALVKLKETLYPSPEDAPRLAMPLLIGIAQLRNRILYEADPFSMPTPNVKVTGGQYDMLHKIFIQLYEYLVKAVPEAEFASLVPPLNELVHSYHLEPELAMLIYRPVLQDLKLKPAPKLARPSEANGDALEEAVTDWTTEPADDNQLAVKLGDVTLTWKSLLGTVQSFHAPATWHIMSPLLYLRFWSLSLSDIYVPKARYLSEIEKVQKAAKDAAKEAESLTGSDQKKRDREAKFLRDTVTNLENELAAQEKTVEAVKQILIREKDQWQIRHKKAGDRASTERVLSDQACGDRAADGRPTDDPPEKRTAISDFFQTCIFPRVTLSLPDALFCFHFLNLLHEINAPGLPTMQVITFVLVKTLEPLVALSSEYEALRYGKFLGKLLKLLQHWKADEETFQRECAREPHSRLTGKEKASKFLDYQEQTWRWHQWITRIIGRHLDSKDPMRIRNSLVVLKELKDIFPAVKKHARIFELKLEKLINGKETTEDILIIARSYKGILIQKQNTMVAPHVFNPRLDPPPARESTPASGRSQQASLPPKASPLGPSRPPSGKPAATAGVAASGVSKRESASDLTAVDQAVKAKPAVNGVAKEAKAVEGREQKLERGEGSPARVVPGREETSTPGSRLNPNAKPFAPKDEPKTKAEEKVEDKRSKRQEWRPKEAKAEPKVEPKPDDTEQEEGEISATPDRKHEPDFEDEHRPRVSDVRKESPVRRESPARKDRESAPSAGEKVPLGKLLATVNRRESVPDRGAPERTIPRGPAPLPPVKKDKDGGRDVSATRERGKESDVGRGRDGDVGRGSDAAREGLKSGRESGESRGIPRNDSKDGLRDVVSERDGLKPREPATGTPPGFPPRSRPNSGTAEGKHGEKLTSGVSERLGSLKEGKATSRDVEKRAKEAEPRRGPVRDEVEGRESRKALLRDAPTAEMGPKVAEGRVRVDEPEGKRVKGETRVSERSNNGRDVIDARTKLPSVDRKAGLEERLLGADERKLSGGAEERRGSKIISLSGRSKASREEGEIAERPDVRKRLSASPADRRASEEGGRKDRGKRPPKEDREEPERERKRHKHDLDAHPSDQRQVVRSLATVDPPRRVVLDDDHPRRAFPEELPRRGGFDDRVRGSVDEPRRGVYEDRGRFLPDDDGRGGGVREVVESARGPYRDFRASEEVEERHRRKEPPAELRRRGPDGERMGRSFSPVPERGGITGRLERVEKDEEATRLREQLLKKQMERSGAKSTGPPPAFEPSRKKGKSGEPHAVMSVAAMELNEDIVEGPSRPSRTEKHHKHERHEEKRGRSRDYDDGEHERKKHERRSHGGKKRRHE